MATAGRTRGSVRAERATDAKVAYGDERAVGQRDQRHQRGDGANHHSEDPGGQRNPQELAKLRDHRIKASIETIAKSLEGNWRRELLFILQQQVDLYDTYQKKIAECDQELEKELKALPSRERAEELQGSPTENGVPESDPRKASKPKKRKVRPHATQFDLHGELLRITGVDLTKIDGVDVQTANTAISEVGYDMSRWKTEAHFVAWLGLCPDNETSGGKVLKRGTRHIVNRLATALRLSAWSLLKSQSYLGAQYRRLRARLGAPKAITAMAARLARLIYRMLKYGEEYPSGADARFSANAEIVARRRGEDSARRCAGLPVP
jgi:transposase